MLREGINGFFMALADSVPGVSGGTVAFIMGFYDSFINSIHNLAFGNKSEKKSAFIYLMKIGIGWIVGMVLSVVILSSLFDKNIYPVSSLFIGFIAGSIPLIIFEEKEILKSNKKAIIFLLVGILAVAGITWLNGKTGNSGMNLANFSFGLSIQLFIIGMIAISAMFLPGISGSTLLLIFGAYIPVITAVKGVLSFDLSYVPCLMFFGFGIIAGALSVVKLIKICLEKYRVQAVYLIIGMMIGSFYAIVMGPTTLEVVQKPLDLSTFSVISAICGCILVLGLQFIKERGEQNAN